MIFYFSNTFAFSDKNEKIVLTLESSLEIAKGKNKDVLIANEDRKRAGAMVREAYSGALPQISMNSVYTRNILKPAFFLKFEDKTQKIEIGQDNSYQNMITFSQPIWLGGKVGTALKIAKAYDNSSEYGFTNTWNNIRAQVEKTFYSVLLAQEAKKISEMVLKNAQAHYENVNKRYAQGMSSEFDLLRAEVNVYNFKPQVIQTENNLKLSYNALKNILGLDIEQEIEIEGVFSYEPIGESVIEEYNKKALDNRPDLKQLEYQTQMQELNVKIERANWYPNFFLTGGFQFQGMSDKFYLKKNQRAFSFSTGIQMQVSLFDGLRTQSRVLQAEADYQKLEYQKDKLLEGIKMEIKQSVLKMKESEQRVESQSKNVVQAEKAMKIAEVRYNSGIGTQLELFDSQIAYENAQMGYIYGIYDYLIAKTDWEKAVGF
jgi:outer membrane protein TolC